MNEIIVSVVFYWFIGKIYISFYFYWEVFVFNGWVLLLSNV